MTYSKLPSSSRSVLAAVTQARRVLEKISSLPRARPPQTQLRCSHLVSRRSRPNNHRRSHQRRSRATRRRRLTKVPKRSLMRSIARLKTESGLKSLTMGRTATTAWAWRSEWTSSTIISSPSPRHSKIIGRVRMEQTMMEWWLMIIDLHPQ